MPSVFSSVDAVVLREAKYKEADRILTLYSAERGRMTVKAPGALRRNSKLSASTQQLTYSNMTLLSRQGMLTVSEAVITEPFSGLRRNFENYALGCYFSECIEALTPEEIPDGAVMQLILNSLYALSNELCSPEKIKAAFELRLMTILGYEPDLGRCAVCGLEEPVNPVLGYHSGHICCRNCRSASVGVTDYLCAESLNAMRYICSAPAKKLLSFEIGDDALRRLSIACEHYIIEHAGRKFSTLDYWKEYRP